jgi:hypothetical protein
MLDFAKYVAEKERISLPLREVKGSTMEQIEKYFRGVLRIDLPWTEKEQAQLQDLQELRNRIAHRNGRIDGLTEDQRQKAQQLASKIKGVEIRNGRLLVSAEYVNSAATLVFNAVEKLEQLVTERYHLV